MYQAGTQFIKNSFINNIYDPPVHFEISVDDDLKQNIFLRAIV